MQGIELTIIPTANIASVKLQNFDVLYVSDLYGSRGTPPWALDLNSRADEISAFVFGGGSVVVGVQNYGGDSRTNGEEYAFLNGIINSPASGVRTTGNDVNVHAVHPALESLTDAALSNWSASYHRSLSSNSLTTLATNDLGEAVVLAGFYGHGKVAAWSLDPDAHQNPFGQLLVENAILWSGSNAYHMPLPPAAWTFLAALIFLGRRGQIFVGRGKAKAA